MLSVTAIVPTCDRLLLLERALRSIAAQELAPAEIIVVDDAGEGHEETTRRAVEDWDLGPVQVVANSRLKGASGARNTGAALACDKGPAGLSRRRRMATVLSRRGGSRIHF